MSDDAADIRWGVEQRLEFIEFRLFWEGGVNRSDITSYFGVSVPQASKDLSQYQALAPENIAYDKSRKRYLKTKGFSPRFLKPDSDQYLAQLQSIADRTLAPAEAWISEPPVTDVLRMPHRNVDSDILRVTLEAVRERKALEIRYQSLSEKRPGPTWRWISPHAFAFDGHRWHVRAFCHLDREFKDFLLPRFLKTRATADAEATAQDDTAWNEFTTVALKPHPQLNDDQKKIVAQDYGMKGDRLNVPVRLALVYYFLKRLNLDFEEEKRLAREQHVVLANPDDVRAALNRAGSLQPKSTTSAAA